MKFLIKTFTRRPFFLRNVLTSFVAVAAVIISACPSRLSADMPTSQFLLVGEGARAEAMGEAVVADCFDQSATFWNPAGMSFAQSPEIGFNSVTIYTGIKIDNASIIYPFKKFSFGLRMITLSSVIDNVDSNGILQSQSLGENDSNYDLIASYKLLDYLSIGAGLGTTSMQYSAPGENYNASTFNGNFGVVYFKKDLSLAASISNIGGTVKLTSDSQGEPQPEVVRFGAAYRTLDDKSLTFAIASDQSVYDKSASGIRFGTEYVLSQYFAARGGLIFENNGDTRPTVGFGFKYAGIGFDLASTISPSSMQDLSLMRFGLSYKFGVHNETEDEQ